MTNKYSSFKAGVYRHYKGPLYLVLGLGHDSNYEDRSVVVYIGLELDAAKTGPRIAVRDYSDFYAYVNKAGEVVDKKTPGAKLRFEFLSNSWDGQR